ncbi:hypothetical protein FRC12_023185 [Ceratobasidium sp. 428]|nr:hypothetical protein FRC12_023185 [Ceratobasidium sp. 428]
MSLLGSFEAAGPLTPRVSAPPATAALPPVRAYAHPHAGHKPSPLGPAPFEAHGRTGLTAPINRWGSSPIGQFGTDARGKSPVAPARNPAVPAFAALALGSVPAPVPAPQPRVYERVSVGESSNWRQGTSTVSTSFPHGVPWEVDALPRQAFPRGPDGRPLQGHIHGAPRNKPPRRWTRHDQRTPSYLPPRRR